MRGLSWPSPLFHNLWTHSFLAPPRFPMCLDCNWFHLCRQKVRSEEHLSRTRLRILLGPLCWYSCKETDSSGEARFFENCSADWEIWTYQRAFVYLLRNRGVPLTLVNAAQFVHVVLDNVRFSQQWLFESIITPISKEGFFGFHSISAVTTKSKCKTFKLKLSYMTVALIWLHVQLIWKTCKILV